MSIRHGWSRPRRTAPYGALPTYCELRAHARPAISIEVRLPMPGADPAWNGGLYQTGCGGFCGILGRADAAGGFINAMGPGLAKGYATATSDGGHLGVSVLDATWAHEDPQAERDWGWRSVSETNRVAAAMIEAFYGDTPEPALFQGCSTGGRMAMRAALQDPEMFDGIIAGAPAMDYPGLVGTKMAYLTQANDAGDGTRQLGSGDAALIGDAVLAQCDAADGVEDGAVGDPAACTPDLSALICADDGADDGACLNDAELATLEAWRAGPRDGIGTQLYPGGGAGGVGAVLAALDDRHGRGGPRRCSRRSRPTFSLTWPFRTIRGRATTRATSTWRPIRSAWSPPQRSITATIRISRPFTRRADG